MADRDDRIAAALPDHRQSLASMARSMCPNPYADADDLAQEGYIAMWRALDRFESGNLAGYLITSARHRMVSVASGKARPLGWEGPRTLHPPLALSLDAMQDEYAWDMPSGEEDPLDVLMRAAFEGEIAQALDALSPRMREAVVARFWHGEQATEITARMHLGNGWWGRVKPKLAERLAHLAA